MLVTIFFFPFYIASCHHSHFERVLRHALSVSTGPNSRSTTPPYPPPAYVLAKYTRKSSKNRKLADVKLEQPGQIQPGELPPEVAKLLGIDKGSPKDGKSPTSMT